MANRNQRDAREARERLRIYEARQTVHRTARNRRRLDNIVAGVAAVLLIAGAATAQALYSPKASGAGKASPSASASATPSGTPSPAASGANVGDIPAASTAEGRTWAGTLTINGIAMNYTVDGAKAPQAVAVWLQEVQQGYFDGKTCHRLVTGDSAQLIQCGSEDGTGATEGDYSFGPVENAPADQVYPAGTIALARASGNAYSQGHQFFITTAATTLPNDSAGGYTVFGTITTKLGDLKQKIVEKGTSDGSSDGPPKVKTTIDAVTVS